MVIRETESEAVIIPDIVIDGGTILTLVIGVRLSPKPIAPSNEIREIREGRDRPRIKDADAVRAQPVWRYDISREGVPGLRIVNDGYLLRERIFWIQKLTEVSLAHLHRRYQQQSGASQ